jgi:hypothetical protein
MTKKCQFFGIFFAGWMTDGSEKFVLRPYMGYMGEWWRTKALSKIGRQFLNLDVK